METFLLDQVSRRNAVPVGFPCQEYMPLPGKPLAPHVHITITRGQKEQALTIEFSLIFQPSV
jgi:hypothetical protein